MPAWKCWPENSGWTGQTEQTERTCRPEHATQDNSARDPGQDSCYRTDRQDIYNMTAWTVKQGEENWRTRVQRQAARTWQVGQASWRDSWDRKRAAGQPWKERCNRTVRKDRTEQLVQNNQDRTTIAGQPGQDSLDRTGAAGTGRTNRTHVAGQSCRDSQDRASRTGQPGQVSLVRSTWKTSLEWFTWTELKWQDCKNMTERTGQLDRTTGTGQSWQVSQYRSAGLPVHASLSFNLDDNTNYTGKVINQLGDNIYVTIQPDDNTKCLRQTVLSTSSMITSILSSSQMTTQNVREKYHHTGDNVCVNISPDNNKCMLMLSSSQWQD